MFNKNLADDGIRTADRFANCLWLLFDLVFRKLDTLFSSLIQCLLISLTKFRFNLCGAS